MARFVSALIVVLCLLSVVPVTAGAVVLSDTIGAGFANDDYVQGDHWLASNFGTGGSDRILSIVTIYGGMQQGTGPVTAQIYSKSGSQPGTLVGTLTSPASYQDYDSLHVFGGNGIALEANSTYWVVLHAPSSSQFLWGFTPAYTSGTGVGFLGAYASSWDAGQTWFASENFPMIMRVEASSAVPLPASLLLFGPGLVGMAAMRKRLRK